MRAQEWRIAPFKAPDSSPDSPPHYFKTGQFFFTPSEMKIFVIEKMGREENRTLLKTCSVEKE